MFGRETPGEDIDSPLEDHLLVTEDGISIRGARLHVVLNHIEGERKSQGALVMRRWI
jgi:hypothetical protein